MISIDFFRSFFLKAFLDGFLVIFGDFGKPKRRPKSTSGSFFFDAYFEFVLVPLCIVFLKLETLKIAVSPRREHDFYKIGVFEKIVKMHGCWFRFRRPKQRKIKKNMC